MDKKLRHELYVKAYYAELDRREKLYARLSLPFGVIVALFGFLSYTFKLNLAALCVYEEIVFYSLFVLSTGALITACYHFKQSWSKDADMFMPTSNETEDYFQILVSTYSEYDESESLIDNAFTQYLLDGYCKCAKHNAVTNDFRSTQIYKMARALTIAIIFSFITLVTYQLFIRF